MLAAIPPHSPVTPSRRFPTLSILRLRFTCGVEGYRDLTPICEAVTRGKVRMEGLVTLNQTLIGGIPSCHWAFWSRSHLSASLPLLVLFNKILLCNSSKDTDCSRGGGGVHSMAYTLGYG